MTDWEHRPTPGNVGWFVAGTLSLVAGVLLLIMGDVPWLPAGLFVLGVVLIVIGAVGVIRRRGGR